MTVSAWMLAAAAVLAAVVAAEVMTAGRGPSPVRRAVLWSVLYVSLAVVFGLGLGITSGWTAAGQFYAGYLTEYSLSVDNLFVFYLIMSWLAVPAGRQQRVLLYGIGLALVLRTALIVAGTAAVTRFGWLFFPLGGFLLWTAFGLLSGRTGHPASQQPGRVLRVMRYRLTRAGAGGRRFARPMMLLVAAIGVADVMFAFDSIPAVFGITTDPVLIVACNVFALMGMRQLYVLLIRILRRLVCLDTGLAVVCAFIGGKLILEALHGDGVRWAVLIPDWLSIAAVVAILLLTSVASIVAQASGGDRAALERRFAVVDTDGNGRWQREDCRLVIRRLCDAFGHPAGSELARSVAAGQLGLFDVLLRHMDTNGDQEISREEFIAGLGQVIADRPAFDRAAHRAALGLVQVADRDRDGVLDSGEYADLAAVYGADADQAAAAFDRLDRDRNGVLDAAELTVAVTRFFTSGRDGQSPSGLTPG